MISFFGTLLTNLRMSLIGKDDLVLLDLPSLDCDWYPFGVSPSLDWKPRLFASWSDEVPSPSSDPDMFLVGRDRRGFLLLIATFRVAAPPLIETFRFVGLLLSLIDDFSFG